MSAHATLFNPRAEARYVRFSVRWTEKAISSIEIAVVRERPLPSPSVPIELPRWTDMWF